MTLQTVTVYPTAVVDAGAAVNASNILGYSTGGSASYTRGNTSTTMLVEFGSPGFSGTEEIVEIRLFVEGYNDHSFSGAQNSGSWTSWYYNGGSSSMLIYYPPGNFPAGFGNMAWASTTYTVDGAVRTHQAQSTTGGAYPFGVRTVGLDPYESIASPVQWNAGMHVPLQIVTPGYSGVTSYMRRARVEIDYLPGNLVRVRDGGVWKDSSPYVRDGGIWKEGAPFVKDVGIWKPTV